MDWITRTREEKQRRSEGFSECKDLGKRRYLIKWRIHTLHNTTQDRAPTIPIQST